MTVKGVCPDCGSSPMIVGRLGIRFCEYCLAAQEAARELAVAAEMPSDLPNPADTSAASFAMWRDGCPHTTVHGPTSADTWLCNQCGFELIPEAT